MSIYALNDTVVAGWYNFEEGIGKSLQKRMSSVLLN
jgi:hypothetical protein